MNKTLTSKWFVDVSLFAGFLIAFSLDLTGLELHQWIGVAVSVLAVYHLVTHWTWVSTVTERFFGKASARARLYYLINASIFTGFFIIGLTGLVISSWLNLSLTNYDLWLTVHIQTSIVALILTILKIGLHWRWVVVTAKKIFSQPAQQTPRGSPTPRPGAVSVPAATRHQTSRRDFMKMMGVVSVASLFALGSAASGLRDASTRQDNGQGVASSSTTRFNGSLDTFGSDDQSCLVQCSRSCSYPGHCQRYTDTNGNNRCDLGECA